MSEERLSRIETKVDTLAEAVDRLAERVATQGDDLRQEMRLLHEDVVGRIADLAPDYAPIRREFKQADAELRESIERRLVPLEAAARSRRRSK